MTGTLGMVKVGFWPNWNGLEWRKTIMTGLEWHGMEEVGFCPDRNGLEWRMSVLS
jgi:hypothetical protein